MKFRKKPVVIEAVQITDATFDAPHPNPEHIQGIIYDPILREVRIPTLEGMMKGSLSDWIVTGVKEEHYPIKDEILRLTYEPIDEAEPQETTARLTLDEVNAIFDGWQADLQQAQCKLCHGTSRTCQTCRDAGAIALKGMILISVTLYKLRKLKELRERKLK